MSKNLLPELSLESWMDDISYLLQLSFRDEPEEKLKFHLLEYLSSRYEEPYGGSLMVLLCSCQKWICRNWGELKEIGFVQNGSVINAILFALYEHISELDNYDWDKVHEVDLSALVPVAQKHLDSES